MVAGLYYDLQVDYSEQLWTEFITSISKTSAKQGISCARYWSLIVQYVYQKEKIEVPDYEEKAVFHMYGSPKEVHDDPTIFTSIARIPDAMLKKVDPTNKVLVSYLQSIDTTVVIGMLQHEVKKKSKKSKKTEGDSSEKGVKDEQNQALIVTSTTVEEVSPVLTSTADTPVIEASPSMETIPSKTGVF